MLPFMSMCSLLVGAVPDFNVRTLHQVTVNDIPKYLIAQCLRPKAEGQDSNFAKNACNGDESAENQSPSPGSPSNEADGNSFEVNTSPDSAIEMINLNSHSETEGNKFLLLSNFA